MLRIVFRHLPQRPKPVHSHQLILLYKYQIPLVMTSLIQMSGDDVNVNLEFDSPSEEVVQSAVSAEMGFRETSPVRVTQEGFLMD